MLYFETVCRFTYRACGGEGDLRNRDHLEDLYVDDKIILKCIFMDQNLDVDWIDLAQDREK